MSIIQYKSLSAEVLTHVKALRNQSGEQALKTNEALYEALITLNKETAVQIGKVTAMIQEDQKRFSELAAQKSANEEHKAELQERKGKLNADIAHHNTQIKELEKTIRENSKELRKKNEQKQEYERRAIDLAKWWWVPGYNFYLLGRTIDDLANQIPRISDRIERDKKTIHKREQEIHTLNAEHGQLIQKLKELEHVHASLIEQCDAIIAKEREYSVDIVTLQTIKRDLSAFSSQITSTEDRNRAVQRFIQMMDEHEKVGENLGGLYDSYEDAFINLGAILDKYCQKMVAA